MRAYLLALVAVISTTHKSTAQTIFTEAPIPCGDWVDGRARGTAQVFEAEMIGYLNGLAIGASREFWHATGDRMSRLSVLLWLDTYCRTYPLTDVEDGAVVLFEKQSIKPRLRRQPDASTPPHQP